MTALKSRRSAFISLLAASTLAIAACGSVEDDAANGTDGTTTAAAAAEGEITVACTADETLCAAWADAFEAESGISTNYVRMSSGEAVARFQAAGDNPEFDVWHAGPVDGFIAATQEGLLEQYESPNAADSTPTSSTRGAGPVSTSARWACSNESRLEELGVDVPTSWDLTVGAGGELMMAHPSTSGTAFTTLWTQVERLGGEDEALNYMRDFNTNILQYTRSGSAPAQSAGRGEVAVAMVFSHDCVSHQEEGFDDLVVSFPEEGTGYEIGGVALMKGSQNPDAAKAYIDWALTPAAQDLGPENNAFQILTHPDAVEDPRMVSFDDITLVDYDFAAAGEARSALTARFDAEVAEEPAEEESN